MLTRTHEPSLSDLRRVYRIFDEARELGGHAYAGRRHLAFELCRLVHARQAYYVSLDGFTPFDRVSIRDMVMGGWPDEQILSAWQRWGARGMLREDPLVNRLAHRPEVSVTARRDRIVSERQWRSSTVYESLAQPNGVGDILISYFRCREPGRTIGFSMQRDESDPPFSRRDRQLVARFIEVFHGLYRAADPYMTPICQPPSPLLSPRQRQVLELLLSGGGAKRAASTLGISPRTFDEYTRALYQKFGVGGRFELMAHFVRGY